MDTLKIAKFELSLFGINTYVVWNPSTGECAIIDPGMINRHEEQALDNFISKNNLKVTHLINTHLHIDHAIGNHYVEDKYGVSTEASKADEFLGQHIKEQARMFGIPEKVEDLSISTPLKDGEIIKIGDGELKVLEVPGHSPGGLALYDKADGFVITGDSLFQGSIGRTDLAGGNHSTLLNSVKKQLLTLPTHTVVYPGHGPATTIGQEVKYNPFLQ